MAGKVAVVTGASRGIGAALAQVLARAGAEVVCVARSSSPGLSPPAGTLDATVAAIAASGGRGHAVQADLRHEQEARAAINSAVALTGRLDILVNNAAAAVPADWSAALKRLDLLIDVNVRAPMAATQEAVPHMRVVGGGRVLNVSSIAATHAIAPLQLYGLSKSALEHLTVSSAVSLALEGIAINCLRIDMPVASEGAMHWDRFDGSAGWVDPLVAAQAMTDVLRRPLDYSGQIIDLSLVADVDDSVRASGRSFVRRGVPEINSFKV